METLSRFQIIYQHEGKEPQQPLTYAVKLSKGKVWRPKRVKRPYQCTQCHFKGYSKRALFLHQSFHQNKEAHQKLTFSPQDEGPQSRAIKTFLELISVLGRAIDLNFQSKAHTIAEIDFEAINIVLNEVLQRIPQH